MTGYFARIPLVRSRRRRPKPPVYWLLTFLYCWNLEDIAVRLLHLMNGDNLRTNAMRVGSDVCRAFWQRYWMRCVDPDDEPCETLRPWVFVLIGAGLALDMTRWLTGGFGK